MSHNKLILLGTGTCQLQSHRMASSILVEIDDLRFVYDFGRGTTQRLAERGLHQDDICHIILSHFHPDHLSDLIPFLQAACWSEIDRRSATLHIYGPDGLNEQIRGILNLFDRHILTCDNFQLQLHELPSGNFSIDNQPFSFVHLLPHNNHGLRFVYQGKQYAFTGDSYFHDEEVAFLKHTDLAVVDAGHISEDEIVELAVRTEVKKLVCTHLYREIDREGVANEAKQKGFKGVVVVGEDLMEFVMERGC